MQASLPSLPSIFSSPQRSQRGGCGSAAGKKKCCFRATTSFSDKPMSLSAGKHAFLVVHLALVPEVVDGAANLGGKVGERRGLAMLLGTPRQPALAALAVAHQQARRLAEGPLQMGVADL